MAKFDMELPNNLIKQFEEMAIATPKMMGEMTKAGATIVEKTVRNNLSRSFKSTDGLKDCLFVSKTYRTPSDDGINNKVMIYGYFINKQGKKVPAPLIANAREYGTSRGEERKPFFRKSFNKSQIESEMLKVQEKYLPKD